MLKTQKKGVMDLLLSIDDDDDDDDDRDYVLPLFEMSINNPVKNNYTVPKKRKRPLEIDNNVTLSGIHPDVYTKWSLTEFEEHVSQMNNITHAQHDVIHQLRRRIKNRMSARKSRSIAKQQVVDLKARVKQLEEENKKLKKQLDICYLIPFLA